MVMNDGFTLDSSWNMANAYFYRIHLAFVGLDQAKVNEDYKSMFKYLETIQGELIAQMTEPEQVKVETLQKLCRDNLNFLGYNKVDSRILTKNLYEYEKYMRIIMRERKMDLPRQRDPGNALLQ